MSESNQNAGSTTDVSTLLATLLSNPEALSKISGVLSKYTSGEIGVNSPPNLQNDEEIESAISPSNKNAVTDLDNSPTEQVFKNEESTLDLSKIASLFKGGFESQKSQNKEQIALLLAIRPYLSPRRKELIDSFIKFSRLGIFLNNFNQNGGANVLQQK